MGCLAANTMWLDLYNSDKELSQLVQHLVRLWTHNTSSAVGFADKNTVYSPPPSAERLEP